MSILKSFLQRYTRNFLFKRSLPEDLGGQKLYVTTRSALGLLKPNLERHDPELIQFVRQFCNRGDRIWDIGANLGIFSCAAAYRAGQEGYVLSVEANPDMASILHRNAQNLPTDAASVDVLCAAVSSSNGIFRLKLEQDLSCSHLSTEGIPVPTYSLDSLLDLFPAPDLIKMDIEGEELSSLKNATRLLSEVRPCLQVEVKPHNHRVLADVMHSNDYELRRAKNPSEVTPTCAYECYMVPNEKVDSVDN